MANYRLATILSEKTMGASGTETIDIKESTPISRITLQLRATNNGNTPTEHPAEIVSKIELVDGSNVLYSLSGKQARAVAIWGTENQPSDHTYFNDDVQNINDFHMYFGRYLWDPDFALDPRKFKNLQLKVTYTRAAGGCSPDALTFAVYGDIFDEKLVAPRGFLVSKQIYSYTGAASTWEYIDLPTDYTYRQILVEARYTAVGPDAVVNKIKLVEDNGRKVPIDETSVSSYLKLIAEQYPPLTEWSVINPGTAGQKGYCMISYNGVGTIAGREATAVGYGSITEIQGGTYAAIANAAGFFGVNIIGWIPHGIFPLMITGDKNVPTDWYNPSRIGSLQLQCYGGSSAASTTTAIIIQQLRPF